MFKTGGELFGQRKFKGLAILGYGNDYLKAYEHIPAAITAKGSALSPKLSPSTVGCGII